MYCTTQVISPICSNCKWEVIFKNYIKIKNRIDKKMFYESGKNFKNEKIQ